MALKSGARVLIVDDHEDNVDLLRDMLEARGYEIETAANGHEALDRVAARAPDLILLDVMMPDLDGIEVARRIKADNTLPFIPIIMQTALDGVEDEVEGTDAGADAYVTKPIVLAKLESRMKAMLRLKSMHEKVELSEKRLAEVNDQLRHISQTDALTGLDNRGHLEERLEEMFGHSQRFGDPLACMMADLDKFKSVNDTYGHQMGDEVLRQLARILRNEAREIDRIGRYGGEEFMLLLPGTSMEAAGVFAERLRIAVENWTFSSGKTEVKRTISCGISAWPHDGISSTDKLVKAADDALYVAKETGRNRVVCFDSREFLDRTGAHHEHGARGQ